jgi:hypothetical protein
MTKYLAFVLASGISVFAHSYGPAPKLTVAPGEDVRACTACHTGNALNSGTGKIEILLSSGNYVPGTKQRVVVRVSDAAQRRWGFELSARLNSNLSNPAGELSPVDNLPCHMRRQRAPALFHRHLTSRKLPPVPPRADRLRNFSID